MMKSSTKLAPTTCAVKVLAADDLRIGDYVTVVSHINEYAPFFWCDDPQLIPSETPLRIRWLPHTIEPPLRVQAVCVPLVLVEASDGHCRQLDIRTVQLARIDRRYAKLALKKLRPRGNKRRSR